MRRHGVLESQTLDFSRPRPGGANQRRREKRYLLGWTLIMTILIAATASSWIFCLYVFNHPEKPFSYDFLTKLERLEPPERFDLYNVPDGKAFESKELFARYLRYPTEGEDRLAELNSELRRNYITNYTSAESVDYASGTFRVFRVQPLEASKVFPSGVVVCAQAVDCPSLTIEYLFPGENIPNDFFRPGDELTVQGDTAFATVINCAEIGENQICLTLIPLVYGTYAGPNGATVALDPPQRLNLNASWPIAGAIEPPVPGETATVATPARKVSEVIADNER